jgi:hypothetical protein
MGSHLFEIDLLTAHEPGIPGGETPPSTAGETPAATEARFMGSSLFKNDLLTAHEPRNCKSLEINETISRFMGSALFEFDLLTGHEALGESPQRDRGTEGSTVYLISLCPCASVVRTRLLVPRRVSME